MSNLSQSSTSWSVYYNAESVVIIPNHDWIEHDFGPGCICGPDEDTVELRKVLTHHSLDGREPPHVT